MENIEKKERNGVLIDWQVKVSRSVQVVEAKPMSVDPTRVRFLPAYSQTGEMTMVVPAETDSAAKEKANKIAHHIVSVGLWEMEIWDAAKFMASIERFL